jgi:transposase-like protein
MTFIAVHCPHCHSEQMVKRGKTRRGTQRYLCQNMACAKGSFLLDYRNRGCLPEVKQTVIDMSLNASGIRDTARVLRISTDTVLSELRKKEATLESVNAALLRTLNPDEVRVDIERAAEAEMDEMWSFVGKKKDQRWLWHAIDHCTGAVLAYVFGRRKDEVFLQLKGLLEPFKPTVCLYVTSLVASSYGYDDFSPRLKPGVSWVRTEQKTPNALPTPLAPPFLPIAKARGISEDLGKGDVIRLKGRTQVVIKGGTGRDRVVLDGQLHSRKHGECMRRQDSCCPLQPAIFHIDVLAVGRGFFLKPCRDFHITEGFVDAIDSAFIAKQFLRICA